LVANVSRPDERVERSTLGALASGEVEPSKTGPVIVLIGNSIGAAEAKRIALEVSRTPIAA
jgi:siroheme synthase